MDASAEIIRGIPLLPAHKQKGLAHRFDSSLGITSPGEMGCASKNKALITNELGFVWLGRNVHIANMQRMKLPHRTFQFVHVFSGRLSAVLLVLSQHDGNL